MTMAILAIVAILLVILFVWLLLREQGERTAVGPAAGVKSEALSAEPPAPVVAAVAPVAAPPAPAAAPVQAVLVEPEPAPIPVVEPLTETKQVETAAPVAAAPAPASQSSTLPAAEQTAPVMDDLEIIEGIGPKIAAVLKQAGVTSFAQLAGMAPARIDEILHAAHLRLADPKSWPEQARLAAAGDQAGLKALQDRLKGGREV